MARLALLIGTAAAVNLRSSIPVHIASGVLGEEQSADNMFDALTNLLANSDGNTPELATFVRSIREMLASSMKPKIRENRAIQQGLVQKSFDAFASCAGAAASREADITAKRNAFQSQAAAHQQCRRSEATVADDSKACAAQQATAQQLQTAACQDFNSFANGGSASCARSGGESYRDYSFRLQAFFQGQVTLFDQKDKACKDATANFQTLSASCKSKADAATAQKARCDQLQDQMDGTSCGIGSDAKASCSAVDACYKQSLDNYNAVVAAARIQEAGLKTEWEAVLRLECLTGVFALADDARGSGIQACRSAEYAKEVAELSLNYPAAPAKAACSVATGLAGSADYAAAQYSPLPASAPAKSCTASCCQVTTTTAPTTTTTTMTTTTVTTTTATTTTTKANPWTILVSPVTAANGRVPVRCGGPNQIQCASNNNADCLWEPLSSPVQWTGAAWSRPASVVASQPYTVQCPGWGAARGQDTCSVLGCYAAGRSGVPATNPWVVLVSPTAGGRVPIRCAGPNQIQCASNNNRDCEWDNLNSPARWTGAAWSQLASVVANQPYTIQCPGWGAPNGQDACTLLGCYA